MNENIKTFYVTNRNNETIAYGSNITDLYRRFSKVYPEARNYQYYYREFKKSDKFTIDGITFQRIV